MARAARQQNPFVDFFHFRWIKGKGPRKNTKKSKEKAEASEASLEFFVFFFGQSLGLFFGDYPR